MSAEDPKRSMGSIRFTIFCSIYLLNNKKLECGRKVLYAGFLHLVLIVLYAGVFSFFLFQAFGRIFLIAGCCFLFNIDFKKYWFDTFSCFWSNLLFAGCFFFVNVSSRKHWFETFSSFSSCFLLAAFFLLSAFPLKLLVFTVNLSRKPKTQNAAY